MTIIQKILAAAAGLFLTLQFLPLGPDRENPAVKAEPPWVGADTRTLFFSACGDCHSNATVWPWYSYVAPVSWLVAHDVEEAREHFNVSEWGREKQDADEAVEMLEDGEMPLLAYWLLHSQARLSDEDEHKLLTGLEATFGRE
jgi:mono/diheme cytochrome c family protein